MIGMPFETDSTEQQTEIYIKLPYLIRNSAMDRGSEHPYNFGIISFPFSKMLELLLDDEGDCGTGCGTDDDGDEDEVMDDEDEDEDEM